VDPELQIKTRDSRRAARLAGWQRAVYTISEAVMTADRSEFVTQLWLADDGREGELPAHVQREILRLNPKWSPDGNWIAFTSNRKENKNNLYLLSMRGGEAEPLTDVKTGVSNFEWSPDGKWIAFTMTDTKTEDEDKNDKARNDFRWVDENLKMSRLYVIPVQKEGNGKT
jgi:dipeptidyl aminopeptidase/acylaminoacyl peptidase